MEWLPHEFGVGSAAAPLVSELGWSAFSRSASDLISRLQDTPHPFGEDLDEGLTVWTLARNTLRRVALDEGGAAKPCDALLRSVVPHPQRDVWEMGTAESDQMHHWSGARATLDADGAIACFAVLLNQSCVAACVMQGYMHAASSSTTRCARRRRARSGMGMGGTCHR